MPEGSGDIEGLDRINPCRRRVSSPALWCLDNVARFNAIGADNHSFYTTVHLSFDPLQIGVETPLIDIVGMAHIVAYHRLFTT